jgi:DNA primase
VSARFEQIVDRYLKVVLRSGDEYMCGCPFCNGSDCLQFNVVKGLWNCFTCSEGGSAKRLVNRLGGTYTDPAISVEVLRAAIDGMKLRRKNRESKEEVLPEVTLARYAGIPHEYWMDERDFSLSTIKKWGLGYDPISDRCTIAYRNVDSQLLGVIQRRLDDVFPRYLYPKGFDRSGSLFGSWEVAARGVHKVALVEGSTDVITVDQADRVAVAQFGSSLTQRQIKLLRRLNVREIVLFYDYDIAGRKAERQAREVLEGFIVRAVRWDQDLYCWEQKVCGCGKGHDWFELGFCKNAEGQPTTRKCRCGRQHNMDPGKLEQDEIQEMYDNAVPVGRIKWLTGKYARSRDARKKPTGGSPMAKRGSTSA